MEHKYPTSEEIRKKIVSMRAAGLTDADSDELRALRRELKSIMLDATAPPSPRACEPDCLSTDYE